MRKVFEKVPKLCSVFTFREDFASRIGADLDWMSELFELLTVVHTDKNDPDISIVTPSCGPASNVGFLAISGEEVLEWISTDSDQFVFCFPPKSFGPSLLFFVRSEEYHRLLLVMLHANQGDIVEKETLIEGVRAVTPSWFWKRKDMTVCSRLQTFCVHIS